MKYNKIIYFQKNDDGWQIELFEHFVLYYGKNFILTLLLFKPGVEDSGEEIIGIHKNNIVDGSIYWFEHPWGSLRLL